MFFFETSDKVKIAVEDLNPKSNKVIVLVHGWPLTKEIFEYQIQPLLKLDYRIVMLDLRGFGDSDTVCCDYSYDRMAQDIYELVCFMHLPHFVLAGFSMGGAIVLRYMGRYNGYNVRKVVFLAAAAPSFTQRTGFPYGVTRESVNKLIKQASADRAQLSTDFAFNQLLCCPHSDAIKKWLRDISILHTSGIATVKCAYSLRDEDCRPDLKHIHVPVGIFHGKKDKVVPYELALVMRRAIPGSLLFTFENSGHAVFYDELERFNTEFITFLEQR